MDCTTCKKHYTQGGNCREQKQSCLFYDEEEKGKMIQTTFSFKMDSLAETPIITQGSKVMIQDNSCNIEITIIRINWINLKTMMCNVDAYYHENEKPHCEKIKSFKIVKQ